MLSKKTVGARCACVVGGVLLLWGCGLAGTEDGTLTSDYPEQTRPLGFPRGTPNSYQGSYVAPTASEGPETTTLLAVGNDVVDLVGTIGFTSKRYTNERGTPELHPDGFRIFLQDDEITEIALRPNPEWPGRLQAHCVAHTRDLNAVPPGTRLAYAARGRTRAYQAATFNGTDRDLMDFNLDSPDSLRDFVGPYMKKIDLSARSRSRSNQCRHLEPSWYDLWRAAKQSLDDAASGPRRRNPPAACPYRDPYAADWQPNWIDLIGGVSAATLAVQVAEDWNACIGGTS